MYERCLDEAERILASEKDVIVAVKKIWLEVSKEARHQGFDVPAFTDFSAMLEGDPRFEFIARHQSVTEDLEDPVPEEETPLEMEQLGFFSGDRVKLRSVDLTPTKLGTIIRTKVDRTMSALTKAWELRPEGDQETEDRLLDILARTQKLQKEVQKTFSAERMAILEKNFKKNTTGGSHARKKKPAAKAKKATRGVRLRSKAAMSRTRRKGHRR